MLLPEVQRQHTNTDWTKHHQLQKEETPWPTNSRSESIIKANWDYLILHIKDVYMYVHKYTHLISYRHYLFRILPPKACSCHTALGHQRSRTRTLLSTLPTVEISRRQPEKRDGGSYARLQCLHFTATAHRHAVLCTLGSTLGLFNIPCNWCFTAAAWERSILNIT